MLLRPEIDQVPSSRSVVTVGLGAVSVAVVVAHNVLVARGIDELGTLAVNGALAAGLLLAAHRCGFSRRDLGAQVERRSWPVAAAAAGVTALAVLVAAVLGLIPADANVAALSTGQVAFRIAIAIPVGTALCEELIFRGVFLAAWDRVHGTRRSTIVVGVLFGAWHVAAEVTRVGRLDAAVVPGLVATAASSILVLCPLRRWSGDLAASVAVHGVANVGVFTAVVLASRAGS